MNISDDQQQPERPVTDPAKPRRRLVWVLAIGLFVSFGLNLAMAGFIAGKAGSHRGGQQVGDPGADGAAVQGLREVARTMNDADRAVLRAVFTEQMPRMRELRKQRRDLGKALRAAMVAEPFDQAAFDAAFDRLTAHIDQASGLMRSALTRALNDLSPDGRRKLSRLRMPGA